MARDVGARNVDGGGDTRRHAGGQDIRVTGGPTLERDCSRERRDTSPEDTRYSDSGGSEQYTPPTQRRRRPITEQDFHRDYNDFEQGERLYRNFLRDQLHQNNLSPPRGDSLFSSDPLEHDLASLAERFSRSEGREQVAKFTESSLQ